MTVEFFLLLVILGGLVYRVTYFILVDSLIEEPRKKVLAKLTGGGDPDRDDWPLHMRTTTGWRLKLTELLTCPYCMSIWVGAVATAITWPTIIPQPDGGWFVWLLVTWLAMSTIALVFWAVIEGHD